MHRLRAVFLLACIFVSCLSLGSDAKCNIPFTANSAHLTCPDGQVISSITSAFWGNNNGCSLVDIQQRISGRTLGLRSYIITSDIWPVTSPNGFNAGRGQMWLLDPCYGFNKFFNVSWCCDTPATVLQSNDAIGTVSILVSASGQPGTSGDKGLAQDATVTSPTAIAIDNRDYLFIVDGESRIRAVSSGDLKGQRSISTVAGYTGPGSTDGVMTKAQFQSISSMSFRPKSNAMQLADLNRIRRVDAPSHDNIEWLALDNGEHSNASTVAGPSTLLSPPSPPNLVSISAIAEYNGLLFIADQGASTVYQLPLAEDNASHLIPPSGPLAIVALINSPSGLAIDPLTGDLFVTDSDRNLIYKVNITTGLSAVIAGSTTLCQPQGLTFQRTVEGGSALYFADSCNRRVMSLNLTTGKLSTILRSVPDLPLSGLSTLFPSSLAFDADGNLYVSDALNNRVWMVSRLCVLSGRCKVSVDVQDSIKASKLINMTFSSSSAAPASSNNSSMPLWAMGVIVACCITVVALIAASAIFMIRRRNAYGDQDGCTSSFSNPWYSSVSGQDEGGIAIGFPIATKGAKSYGNS